MRHFGHWKPLARAWEDLRRGAAATHPASAALAHVDCESARSMCRALGGLGDSLQQGVVFIDSGVAAHADPLGCPSPALALVGWGPVHMAIRQFLPSSIRCGMRRVCQEDAWAAKRQNVFRGPRCCGFVVAARRGVVIGGRLWSGNTVHPAGSGEVFCCLRWPWGLARRAPQMSDICGYR